HYTHWLWWSATGGVIFLIYGLIHHFQQDTPSDKDFVVSVIDNPLTMPYALFTSVWSTLFLEFWKRKSHILAYEWNMLDYERRERARPEFKPTGVRTSPITGKKELYYPRYLQVASLVSSGIIVLVSVMST